MADKKTRDSKRDEGVMIVEAREYRTMDKSDWGPGEWQNEPDKIQWQDAATGFPCLIVRGNCTGALCGYVGVPEGHPDYRKDYNDVDVDAGLTYADFCQGREFEAEGICHVPAVGEPDQVWWLGFDCAHAGDISPAFLARERRSPLGAIAWPDAWAPTYKTIAYVKEQVELLALQLKQRAVKAAEGTT